MKKEFLFFSTSNLLLQGVRFVTFIYAMKSLGPQQYGLWVMLLPLITYSTVLAFGVPNAMNRLIPIMKGKSDLDGLEEVREVGLSILMASAVVISFVLLFASNWLGNNITTVAVFFVFLLLLHNFQQYIVIVVRSDNRFKFVALESLIQALCFPVLVLLGLFIGGLRGFLLGQAIALAISSLTIVKLGRIPIRLRFSMAMLLRLAREGIPQAIVALLFGLASTVDRFLIGSMLGPEQVGYYGLSILINGVLLTFHTLLAQMMYPKFAYQYGVGSWNGMFELYRRHWNWGVGLFIPMFLFGIFGACLLVPRFLPMYVPGMQAMQIGIVGSVVTAFSMPWANILLVAGYHRVRLGIALASLVLSATLCAFAIKMGFGIEGVAFASVVVSIVTATLFFVGAKYFLTILKIDRDHCESL